MDNLADDMMFQDKETGLWHFVYETLRDHSEGFASKEECEAAADKYFRENFE